MPLARIGPICALSMRAFCARDAFSPSAILTNAGVESARFPGTFQLFTSTGDQFCEFCVIFPNLCADEQERNVDVRFGLSQSRDAERDLNYRR